MEYGQVVEGQSMSAGHDKLAVVIIQQPTPQLPAQALLDDDFPETDGTENQCVCRDRRAAGALFVKASPVDPLPKAGCGCQAGASRCRAEQAADLLLAHLVEVIRYLQFAS